MIREKSFSYKLIDAIIYLIIGIIIIACILPFLHEIAVSFSSRLSVIGGKVQLIPVKPTLDNYSAIWAKPEFGRALFVSIIRVAVAVPATLLVVILTAYPLAMERLYFPGRRVFMMVMIFANLFQVGLIPRFLSYKNLHLIDNFLVLILPLLLTTFNVILTMNFFKGIPFEMIEAAMLDGASHWDILTKLMVPLSTPVLATISLFTIVAHWNAYFDGIVYIRDTSMRPLQSYLFSMLTGDSGIQGEFGGFRFGRFPQASPDGAAAAMILFAILPVFIIYPFVQRYIISGMHLGSVKE